MENANEQIDRPTWIVFDAAGTLIHLPKGAAAVYSEVGKRHGVDVTAEYINQRFTAAYAVGFDDGLAPTSEQDQRARWREVVRYCFSEKCHDSNASDEIFADLWSTFERPETWAVDPGLGKLLDSLDKLSVRYAIASNFDSRLKTIVESSETLSRAEGLYLSSEIGFNKPCKEFYKYVHRSLGEQSNGELARRSVLMVGDSLINDVQGAIDFGWHAVHYCPNHPIRGRPMPGDDDQGDRVSRIGRLDDLLDLFCYE